MVTLFQEQIMCQSAPSWRAAAAGRIERDQHAKASLVVVVSLPGYALKRVA
jgi:hypothetical protein